jgi:LysM repeat protein
MATYQIQSGDTLGNIAGSNKRTIQEILALNPQITDPNRIYAGQTLTIPTSDQTIQPTTINTPTNASSGIDLNQFSSDDPLRKFNLAILDMLKKAQSGETKMSQEKAQLEREAYRSGQQVFTGEEALMTPEAKMATLNRNVEMFNPSIQTASTRLKQLGDTIDLLKTTYGEDFSNLLPATEEEAKTIKNALRSGITVDAELLKRYSKYLTEDDFIKFTESQSTPKETYSEPYSLDNGEIVQRNEATGEIKVISKTAETTSEEIDDTAATVLSNINDLLSSNIGAISGALRIGGAIPGSKSHSLKIKLEQIVDALALNARKMLKGTGTISDFEAKMLKDAQTTLANPGISEDMMIEELKKIRAVININAGKMADVEVYNNQGQMVDDGPLNREDIYSAVSQGFQIKYK